MKIGIIIIHARKHRASRYIIEVGKYFAKKHKIILFTNRHDSLDKKIKIKKIPLPKAGFRIQEILFTLLSSIIVKLYGNDITMSQATRFFSPDIAYQQFIYKEWHKRTKSNSFLNNLVNWMEGYNLRKAKKIIAMSNVVKNEIIRNYGIGSNKIKTIYSAADLNFFNPKHKKTYRKKIREELGFSDSDKIMIFVGNPFQRKGLDYLIRALPMIKPAKAKTKNKTKGKVKLLVMGRDNKEPYIRLAEKLGVSNRIVFGGFTPDINQYFSAADMFVFPTLYEPFGLVILEAMASGLPVVVSSEAGASELIEDGKDGLLLDNPASPKEIAEKVNYIIKNKKLMNKISKNAEKLAENYNWNIVAEKWLKMFEVVK